MECRRIVITLVSANHLPDVRSLGHMKVYAKISIKGESARTSKKTRPDNEGECNPTWDFPVDYTLSETTVQNPRIKISIRLYCKRTLGDRYIGEVVIPIKGLFDKGIKCDRVLSYHVAGTGHGKLNLLYSFGDKFVVGKAAAGLRSNGDTGRAGFLVLLGGEVLVLSDKCVDDDGDDSRDVHGVEDEEDDDVFYDAC